MQSTLFRWLVSSKNPQVLLMYFGRISDSLLMTSEYIDVPKNGCTVGQVLSRLRKRDSRWAYELDVGHILCCLDEQCVSEDMQLSPGMTLDIHARKSILEP